MPTPNPFDQIPERMQLTNVENADAISAQFNPEQMTEELSVMFNKLAIMGLSHQPLQYTGSDTFGPATPDFARRFLLSLCYSSRNAVDVLSGGTPRLLLQWGRTWALQTKIMKLKFVHKRFNSGQRGGRFGGEGGLIPTFFTAQISSEEWRVTRLYSEDVFVTGTVRAP